MVLWTTRPEESLVATTPVPPFVGDNANLFSDEMIASPIAPDRTMKMEVGEIGFLLERLGADCGDQQYLRELTMNSLEAEAMNVIWDVDWMLHEATAGVVYKLCCIDDGRGMSAREMIQHINNLSFPGAFRRWTQTSVSVPRSARQRQPGRCRLPVMARRQRLDGSALAGSD